MRYKNKYYMYLIIVVRFACKFNILNVITIIKETYSAINEMHSSVCIKFPFFYWSIFIKIMNIYIYIYIYIYIF